MLIKQRVSKFFRSSQFATGLNSLTTSNGSVQMSIDREYLESDQRLAGTEAQKCGRGTHVGLNTVRDRGMIPSPRVQIGILEKEGGQASVHFRPPGRTVGLKILLRSIRIQGKREGGS
jgi:hypothetical protein